MAYSDDVYRQVLSNFTPMGDAWKELTLMGRHPGDYDLVIYEGKIVRAVPGTHSQPKIVRMRIERRAQWLPVKLDNGLLHPRWWSLARL